MFIDPRAFDINEITLACVTFTYDSYLVVVQEPVKPFELQLIVRGNFQRSVFRNMIGCDFFQEFSGNWPQRCGALDYSSLAMGAFWCTWRFPRPTTRKLADP